jgi:hypothetical protein
MRRIAITAALLLGACVSAPTEQPADKTLMARRFADLQNPPEVWRVYAQTYVAEALQKMPDYSDLCETAVEVDSCEEIARKMVGDMRVALNNSVDAIELLRPALIDDYAKAVADTYTADELSAALAFADSPLGRSMNKKAATFYARTTASEYARLRGWTDEIERQLLTVYNNYARDLEAAFSDSGTPTAN